MLISIKSVTNIILRYQTSTLDSVLVNWYHLKGHNNVNLVVDQSKE